MKNRRKISFFMRLYAKFSITICRIAGIMGHKKPYLKEEDEIIKFNIFSDSELSKLTGRTVRAIQQRKYLLNRNRK